MHIEKSTYLRLLKNKKTRVKCLIKLLHQHISKQNSLRKMGSIRTHTRLFEMFTLLIKNKNNVYFKILDGRIIGPVKFSPEIISYMSAGETFFLGLVSYRGELEVSYFGGHYLKSCNELLT